jgi:hypothetical protein
MRTFRFLAAVLCLVLGGATLADEPGFTFQLDRPDNKIGALSGKEGTTFELTAYSRVGRAEITTKGAWPSDLAVQFKEYNDQVRREFRFTASNGKVTLSTGFHPDREEAGTKRLLISNPSVWWYDADGKYLDGLSSRVRYIVTVENDTKQRLLRIVLPPGFCGAETKSLRLQWVMALD